MQRSFGGFGIHFRNFFGRRFFGRATHHGANGFCFCQGFVAALIQIAFTNGLIFNDGFGIGIGLILTGILALKLTDLNYWWAALALGAAVGVHGGISISQRARA